ncbi:hypothetical protein SD10_20000 [Spirosoma radiotolerans]|uniref:Uncharacterized protein n=1 Tax=Spirosoma radiotolerans TaxID=1379870 RepID=A0A0E3V955_9BACT|nr:hypothetical protein SD10_20000 [Spirosoma radiotolerans]
MFRVHPCGRRVGLEVVWSRSDQANDQLDRYAANTYFKITSSTNIQSLWDYSATWINIYLCSGWGESLDPYLEVMRFDRVTSLYFMLNRTNTDISGLNAIFT